MTKYFYSLFVCNENNPKYLAPLCGCLFTALKGMEEYGPWNLDSEKLSIFRAMLEIASPEEAFELFKGFASGVDGFPTRLTNPLAFYFICDGIVFADCPIVGEDGKTESG